jgi:hypothetical protein
MDPARTDRAVSNPCGSTPDALISTVTVTMLTLGIDSAVTIARGAT